MGRPSAGLPGRREHGAVAGMRARRKGGAARMEGYIERNAGIHIPHRTIHAVLEADGEVEKVGKYFKRKEWVRWECSHSNMMWHTDFMQLPGGRWLIAYEDDASRRIMAHGAFMEEATAANAIAVLHGGMDSHGRPASLMTDHGSQFFANEAEGRRRGEASFESELERLNIWHVLARVAHPQTNGKIERFHRVVRRHLDEFEAEASRTATRSDLPGGGGAVHRGRGRATALGARRTPCRGWCTGTTTRWTTCRLTRARRPPWPTSARCLQGYEVTDGQSGIAYRREWGLCHSPLSAPSAGASATKNHPQARVGVNYPCGHYMSDRGLGGPASTASRTGATVLGQGRACVHPRLGPCGLSPPDRPCPLVSTPPRLPLGSYTKAPPPPFFYRHAGGGGE